MTDNNQQKPNELIETESTMFGEFWTFLMENKVWWLTPFVLFFLLAFLCIGWSLVTGGGIAAPFIYSIF